MQVDVSTPESRRRAPERWHEFNFRDLVVDGELWVNFEDLLRGLEKSHPELVEDLRASVPDES